MDRGAWWVTFHEIEKSQTGLNDYTFLFLPSHPHSYSFNLISLSHLFLWSNLWKETYTAILSSSSHPMHSATHYIWLSSLSLKLPSEEDRRGPVASLPFKQLDTIRPSSGICLTASGIWHCHALFSKYYFLLSSMTPYSNFLLPLWPTLPSLYADASHSACPCVLIMFPRFLSLTLWATDSTLYFLWSHSSNDCLISFIRCHPVQCSSISQSSLTLQPHGLQQARPPCPSPTPGAYSLSCPSSWWCHPTISSSVVPFSSHLQSFPASGSFPMSQFFASGGQNFGVSASASVLPMNIQCWFPLGWTDWISLQSKGLSRVFSNTTVKKHQFFSTQLSL